MEIVLAVDNTAVVGALRRGFSGNKTANMQLQTLQAALKERRSILQVVGIPGALNAADPMSRGSSLKKWARKELAQESWDTIQLALAGLRYDGPLKQAYDREMGTDQGAPPRHCQPLDGMQESNMELEGLEVLFEEDEVEPDDQKNLSGR